MDLFHHGYGLQLEPCGPGYWISIFPPGEIWCMAQSPSNRDPARREELIAEAKAIIDGQLSSYL
jgi:hypothetical protein